MGMISMVTAETALTKGIFLLDDMSRRVLAAILVYSKRALTSVDDVGIVDDLALR